MTRRPDLVDVWLYRVTDQGAEVLLMRRAPARVLPGLWQGVSGLVEPGESVVGAALREVREETGLSGADIEAQYHLDHVAEFLWQPADTLMTSASFAFRIVAGREPALSHEHDALRWTDIEAAIGEVVWPGYREALERLRDNLLEPGRARWFAVEVDEPGG